MTSGAPVGRKRERVVLTNSKKTPPPKAPVAAQGAAGAGRAKKGRRATAGDAAAILAFEQSLERGLLQHPEPRAQMRAACEILGLRLGADRVGYAKIDRIDELFFVTDAWVGSDLPKGVGAYRLETFGLSLVTALRAGRTVGIADVETHEMTANDPHARAGFGDARIRASLNVPLVKDGHLFAVLFVHGRAARTWTATEFAIVEIVADRTRQAVETARDLALMRRNDAKFQAAQNNSVDGLIGFDSHDSARGEIKDFQCTHINRAAARMLGRSVNELIGLRLSQVLPGLRDELLVKAYAEVMADGETRTGVSAYVHGEVDRIFRWVAAKAEEGLAVWLIDVTDQMQTEARLRESEQRFRAAVEALQGILWTNDAEGKMTGDQPGWGALTGQTPSEYEGFGWAAAVHPEDAAATITAWEAAVAQKRPFAFVHRLRRADGTWGEYSVRAVPTIDEAGRITQWVGVHSDISKQRAAERALRESQDALINLNERLEERVLLEMSAKEDALSRVAHNQRMEALGQLAGGVAHDFNNVLQAMVGGLGLIEKRAGDPETVKTLAGIGLKAGVRGAAITNRLLAFSRRGELRADSIAAAELFEPIREMLGAILDRTLTIDLRIAPDAPPLVADKAQLETVLINLAVNARDAMSDGGVLTLGWAAETIEAAGAHPAGLAPGRYVRLDVSDTGAGMDAATLRRAGEPFFTTKPPGQGTGLGLPMAQGLAEQSGGGFAITSRLGAGTRVSMWFPQSDGDAPRTSADAAATATSRHRGLALVVDDDPIVLDVLVHQLEGVGFETCKASSGLEALSYLAAGLDPQILVTDYAMPGMNGMDLLAQVRRSRPRLPALLLTGFADGDVLETLERGTGDAAALLRKPVSHHDLARGIAGVLDEAADRG